MNGFGKFELCVSLLNCILDKIVGLFFGFVDRCGFGGLLSSLKFNRLVSVGDRREGATHVFYNKY